VFEFEAREILLLDYHVRRSVDSLSQRDGGALPAGSIELRDLLAAEAGRETVAVVTARGSAPVQVSGERGSGEAATAVIVQGSLTAEMGTAQAAARLGITPRAVRNLCHSGDLLGRIGPAGRWLVSEWSVTAEAARRKGA
jgi:hypothetical protein